MTVTLANPTTTIFEQARQAYAEKLEVDAQLREQREREEIEARERAKRDVADQLQAALKEKLGLDVTISTGELIGDDYSANQINHMRFELYPFLRVGFSNRRHAQGALTGSVVNRVEYEHSLNSLATLGMLLAKADEARAQAEANARQHAEIEHNEEEPAAPPPERPRAPPSPRPALSLPLPWSISVVFASSACSATISWDRALTLRSRYESAQGPLCAAKRRR